MGNYAYPILADPEWTYSLTAIARKGTGAIIGGKETVARAYRELKRCFKCSFPISGAPRSFPLNGKLLRLNASPLTFIEIPAPVRIYRSNTSINWTFVAQKGHFDGGGSRIKFKFYKPSGYPVRIAISAVILKDNGWIRNQANAYVAKTQWNNFATKLVLNTRKYS